MMGKKGRRCFCGLLNCIRKAPLNRARTCQQNQSPGDSNDIGDGGAALGRWHGLGVGGGSGRTARDQNGQEKDEGRRTKDEGRRKAEGRNWKGGCGGGGGAILWRQRDASVGRQPCARLQPQRGCVTKPRAGPKGQPWVAAMEGPSTPTGLWPPAKAGDWFSGHRAATPLGLTGIAARLPRVGAAPTLGFAAQPRWGWSGEASS
jgi:hypothetical protein